MTASDHVLSVTELNRRARQLLEVHLANVWVRGEISNLATPSSGHWYFTLKDEKAQIRCAMFRGSNALLRFRPEHGMQVIARGRISIYEGRGDYQLIVEHLTPDGAGNLQIAFEQLKARLEDEGLFDEDFKQELPAFPGHVAVVTSPTGAAIRDILSVFQRRFPATLISILPVPVQGPDAAPAIVRAIQQANRQPDIEALILARGGGSLEDLWAFNEESVARAVFASEIPVVSAIGHETDFTICDFVADVRAPTPSAAAELLSPDLGDFQTLLDHYLAELQKHVRRQFATHRMQLLGLLKRLRHPGHVLREQQQALDHLEWRLLQTQTGKLSALQVRLDRLQHRLQQQHPGHRLQDCRRRLAFARQQLVYSTQSLVRGRGQQLGQLASLLDSLSPLGTLRRGYAIARDRTGQPLTAASQVHAGEAVRILLAQGELACEVLETLPDHTTLDRNQ